jgi:hypothetical protein
MCRLPGASHTRIIAHPPVHHSRSTSTGGAYGRRESGHDGQHKTTNPAGFAHRLPQPACLNPSPPSNPPHGTAPPSAANPHRIPSDRPAGTHPTSISTPHRPARAEVMPTKVNPRLGGPEATMADTAADRASPRPRRHTTPLLSVCAARYSSPSSYLLHFAANPAVSKPAVMSGGHSAHTSTSTSQRLCHIAPPTARAHRRCLSTLPRKFEAREEAATNESSPGTRN